MISEDPSNNDVGLQKLQPDGNQVQVQQLRRTRSNNSNRTAPIMVTNDQRVKLERVIGSTVNSRATLACESVNGFVAYTAGCTVVLYNSKRNRQTHITNVDRKSITCVAFSPDGNFLATGECGHQPSVRVWEMETRTQVTELRGGHNFGVCCMAFSPDSKYIISVGNQHDNVVNVWNWKTQRKAALNKISCQVKALSFAENGSYFVTVGLRHVKFWYLDRSKTATPKYQDTVPLQGRSAILADQRNNNFCDVACGRGATSSKTYAITQSGLLCEFSNRRLLEKWLDLKTRSAYALAIGDGNLFVGCAEGTVHVFKADGLAFLVTLPRPHYLGVEVNLAYSNPNQAKYPDVVAVAFDDQLRKLTCCYNDRSMYQWEINDYKHIGKSYSALAHGGCIWGLDVYPSSLNNSDVSPVLPPGTFVTCSSDDTIRVWNIDPNMPTDSTLFRRNMYSHELLKIVYCDPQMAHLCDSDTANSEKTENQYDGKNGIRSVKFSPDGQHLVSGDRLGTLRLFSVRDFSLIKQLEAHDGEVLCLEYSPYSSGEYYLASASRDRLLHVLDPQKSYSLVGTIDDHSSSITAVKFAPATAKTDLQPGNELQMLSCGADKSVIIRKKSLDSSGNIQFVRANYLALQTTVYDMDIDRRRRCVYAACQDRQIRVYNINDGKLERSFKGSTSDDGTLIKLELDPSGSFVATSANDKQVFLLDARTGDPVACMAGHGELVTGLKFTIDCRHLITVSGDGCIFIWRLGADLTNYMLSKQARLSNVEQTIAFEDEDEVDENDGSANMEAFNPYLPSWAKKMLGMAATESPENQSGKQPMGKWAASCVRPEPVGWASTDMKPEEPNEDHTFISQGNVQKLLRQFESDKHVTSERGQDLQAVDGSAKSGEFDDSKPEVVYYPTGNDASSTIRNFVVEERSASVTKPYRGADTIGDASDDEGGHSGEAESSNLRPSESVGELHPRQHRMVKEAFETLETPERLSDMRDLDSSFERGGSSRQSLTSRHLHRNPAGMMLQSNTGRSRWNMPTSVTPAKIIVSSATPTPPTNITSINYTDGKSDQGVLRAKRLSDAAARLNRDRRQTFAFENQANVSGKFNETFPGDGDYALSELHQRSRSQSRSRLAAENTSFDDHLTDSQSSGFNRRSRPPFSYFTPPANVMNSRSMTSLASPSSERPTVPKSSTFCRESTPNPSVAGPSLKRVSDVRDKLRKSRENLTQVNGGSSVNKESDAAYSSRSKSIGNLYTGDTPRKSSIGSTKSATASRISSLMQSRNLAASMGSLRSGISELSNATHIAPPVSLGDSLSDLKRASNTDLSNMVTEDTRQTSGSFYGKVTTLPRRYVAGTVQKKAQAIRSRRMTGDRASISGESEDSTDFYDRKAKSQVLTPRRLEMSELTNSSRSSSPATNNQMHQQQRTYEAARQIFEAKRQSQSSLAPTQSSSAAAKNAKQASYLAKILNESSNNELNQSSNSAQNNSYFSPISRHRSEGVPSAAAKRAAGVTHNGHHDQLAAIVDSCDNHFDKMSGHCKDSLHQFRTSLDKMLQAFAMVNGDTDLTEEERDRLLTMLSVELESAQVRLSQALTQQRAPRREPEGARVGAPQQSSSSGGRVATMHRSNTTNDSLDSSTLLQQYSDMLVSLIQQKMSSSDK